MRSRDIVLLERELKDRVPPALMRALITICEDQTAMKQQIMALASLFNKLVDNQITIANATDEMRKLSGFYQRMKQAGTEVGSDPSLTGDE